MFQRQTREPFPVRNIIVLAAVVLAFLVFILSQIRKPAPPAPPPATEQAR